MSPRLVVFLVILAGMATCGVLLLDYPADFEAPVGVRLLDEPGGD